MMMMMMISVNNFLETSEQRALGFMCFAIEPYSIGETLFITSSPQFMRRLPITVIKISCLLE